MMLNRLPATSTGHASRAVQGAALAFIALASPAMAQETADIAGSILSLQATEQPGAVAELVFVNIATNHPSEDGEYTLSVDGLTVVVTFTWGNNADSIAVAVPEGFIASPAFLDQPEDSTGVVYIYAADTVGM